MWRVLDWSLEKVELFFFALSAVAVVAMTLSVGADVAIRSATGGSPGWLSDFPTFFNITLAFTAMAFVLRRRQHIVVDVLLLNLTPAARRAANIVALCIAQVFFVALFWGGLQVAWRSYELGNMSFTSVEVPMFIPQAAVPLGALLLVCEGLAQLAKALWGEE